MLDPISQMILPAATARFVLLANHVLAAAPAATERLKPHAGRRLQVEADMPRLPFAPAWPPLLLSVTPAGLLESPDAGTEGLPADLRLRVDFTQPLETARRLALGEQPPVHVEGDAALAGEINWILAHVRWDIAADLEKVFGPAVAEGLSQLGEKAQAAARSMMQGMAGAPRKP